MSAAMGLASHARGQATETSASAANEVDVGGELAAASFDLSLGDARAALRRLERVAELEPDNPWVLYYRGAALGMLRQPYAAMEALDAADARLAALGDPDPELRERIAEERARARKQVFELRLEMGLAYDTNVTFTGTGGQDFGFISGRSDGVFGTRAQWSFAPVADDANVLAFNVRTAQAWHFKVKEFDFQNYGASLRYARRWDDHWESSITYNYDFSVLERQSYLCNHALVFGLDHHWAASGARVRGRRSGVFYRISAEDFLFPVPEVLDRDGIAHAVGLEQAVQIQPLADANWVWELSAGYMFESVHTQGREFDHYSNNFFLRCGLPLLNPADTGAYLLLPDKEMRVEFDAIWELDQYRHPSLYDDQRKHRRDLVTTCAMRISQVLQSDPRDGDITLNAIIAWTDSDSNVLTDDDGTPFSYDRMFYGLQIAWSW